MCPPSEEPTFRIFLSHAGEDKETVGRPLYNRLCEHGLSVFFDIESFREGDHCPNVMNKIMETAPVGIFIMSPEFVAKEWCMRELLAFVRRYEYAAHNTTPVTEPLLIPVFYRLSTRECRNPAIFDKYSELFLRHGVFKRAMDGSVPLHVVSHALDVAATLWGIENDLGASNLDRPNMAATRESFIQIILEVVLGRLDIPLRQAEDKYHTTSASLKETLVNEYKRSFDVPTNMPYVLFNMHSISVPMLNASANPETKVKHQLLLDNSVQGQVIGITGLPGVGKTSMLKALAQDEEVRARFCDGIAYISLGMEATESHFGTELRSMLHRFGAKALARALEQAETISDIVTDVRNWFEERAVLLMVDDLWARYQFGIDTVLQITSLRSKSMSVIFTTRDSGLASKASKVFNLNPLEPKSTQARQILLHCSHFQDRQIELDQNKVALESVLERCAGLPLCLSIAGQSISKLALQFQGQQEDQSEMAWAFYACKYGVDKQVCSDKNIIASSSDYHQGLSSAVRVALEILQERLEQASPVRSAVSKPQLSFFEMFASLCVLKRKDWAPTEMLKRLWRLSDMSQTLYVVSEIASVGIMERKAKVISSKARFGVQIHDLIHECALLKANDSGKVKYFHETLLNAYCSEAIMDGSSSRNWWSETIAPDGYIHENLCRLLVNTGLTAEVVGLLHRPEWTARQLSIGGIKQFEQDVNKAVQCVEQSVDTVSIATVKAGMNLISEAARLSSNYIAENRREIWFQLYGRLGSFHDSNSFIRDYLDAIGRCATRPWLKPGVGFLIAAGDPCIRIVTVARHLACPEKNLLDSYVSYTIGLLSGLASTLNPRQFVCSSGANGKIAVVDVITGDVVGHRECHGQEILGLAVSRLGKVVTCSRDKTVKVLDLETLSMEHSLQHDEGVQSVTVTPDGRNVVSGSSDGNIQIWDIENGVLVRPAFRADGEAIVSIAVTHDGRHIIAGGDDGMVRIWDIESGQVNGPAMNAEDNSRPLFSSVRTMASTAPSRAPPSATWPPLSLFTACRRAHTRRGCQFVPPNRQRRYSPPSANQKILRIHLHSGHSVVVNYHIPRSPPSVPSVVLHATVHSSAFDDLTDSTIASQPHNSASPPSILAFLSPTRHQLSQAIVSFDSLSASTNAMKYRLEFCLYTSFLASLLTTLYIFEVHGRTSACMSRRIAPRSGSVSDS